MSVSELVTGLVWRAAKQAQRVIELGLGQFGESVNVVPTLGSGDGAPTHDRPDGSVYYRRDASTLATAVYFRVSGAWVAGGALVASSLSVDTIAELTAATGVTVDGVLLKDSQVTTDQINEKTPAAGVTVDGVLLKDGGVTTDTIAEATPAAGVTIDGVLLKDGVNRGKLYATNVFVSAELTGTGANIDSAHALSTTPALVFVIPSDLSGGVFTVVYGAHDATVVKTTVTTGEKYRVVAFK